MEGQQAVARSPVVPSGKIATVCPAAQRRGHRVDDAQRVALALALEVERAGRDRPGARQRPAPHVGLGDEARLRHDRVDGHDVEPGDVVGDQQAAAARPARPSTSQADAERRAASAATTSGCAASRSACVEAREDGAARWPARAARARRARDQRPQRERGAAPRRVAPRPSAAGRALVARRGRRPASSARRPGSSWPTNGVCRPWLRSAGGSTVHALARRRRRTGRPARPRPGRAARFAPRARRDAPASTPPGRLVTVASVSRQAEAGGRRPTCSARPSSSSRPVAPGSASANGRFLASSATGVWSLTSASIVPSARPARIASRSRCWRSGGIRRIAASK